MPRRSYINAKTSVFWDVEDFPNPNGRSFYEIIKSVLVNEGYHGDVSITAYGEEKPDDLEDVIAFVPKRGKYWRLNKMLVDIGLWAVDNRRPHETPTNLMVIAKNIPEETEFAGNLDFMETIGHNVILVLASDCVPEEIRLPEVYTVWFWESLLDGAKPLESTQRRSLLARAIQYNFGGGKKHSAHTHGEDATCRYCQATGCFYQYHLI